MKNERIARRWDEISDSDWYKGYRTKDVIDKIVENPSSAFHHVTWEMLKQTVGDFVGKKICVPSSGDNHAVFAFAVLGARVTSCDISSRQIENAEKIANERGFDIEFVCDDTMTLGKLSDNTYDFVYTSNGVHIWIDDLKSMYKNIYRILKGGGKYLMYDIHPFGRPFSYDDVSDNKNLIIEKSYDQTGPHGDSYHWRVGDLVNAIISSGFSITQMEEMFAEYGTYWYESSGGREHLSKEETDSLYDWKTNPLAALPQWISISAKK